MITTTRFVLCATVSLSLLAPAGCGGVTTDDVFASLETGEATESSLTGPASHGAPWARELFDERTDVYVYQDENVTRGAVFFSDLEICQFQEIDVTPGRLRIGTDHCSGAIEGASLELRCRQTDEIDIHCVGQLSAPQGETVTASGLRDIVEAPDGTYEGPYWPLPDTDENGNCPGAQSPCGPDSCCDVGERCGDGQCWKRIE